jgi:hypothetical protein
MLLSYVVPCHKREQDLRTVLPNIISAAKASPPVEIVVVDYANSEALVLPGEVKVVRHVGNGYFHLAHSRNVGIRACTGDYIISSNADTVPNADLFSTIRGLLRPRVVWLEPEDLDERGGGACPWLMVCQREEFIASGGYDERIEFYNGDDKDLLCRLRRRGKPHVTWNPLLHVTGITTPNVQKVENYRLNLSKNHMMRLGKKVREENIANKVLVVNTGLEWGESDV